MNKTFYILSIIAVVALIIIVIVEFDLGFIPSDNANEMNSILTLLCSGYLGGYLTYTTTVYIPNIIDYRKTKGVRKKSFAIITEIVRGHIVAYINGGIRIDARKITAEELMECLKEHHCTNNASYLQTTELFAKKYGYSYPPFRAKSSSITQFGLNILLQRTIKFYQTLRIMLFTEC